MEIKTLSRGVRGGTGGFPRAVAHVAAAVLAVTAMLAATWAGPVASASAGTQPRAASRSPAPVKFYIVPPPGNGHAESLFTIAAQTLGDGSRFMEIFNLNKGRPQPDGGRLTSPQLIEPGWILQLPPGAAGPGVHFGPLPVVTAPPAHRPAWPAGTGTAIMISGALLALLTAGLAFRLIRRRAGPARRRRPAHARAPGGAGRASRRGLQHDHDRDTAWPSAPAPPGRALAQSGSPPAGWRPPAAPAAGIRRRAAQLGRTPGPAPQACHDADRLQVVGTGSPATDPEGTTGPGARVCEVGHRPAGQPAATSGSFRAQQPVGLANRTLPDPDHQAAETRQQGSAEAAALRQASEWDAADLRSALRDMRAELDRVAAHVAGSLQSPAMPVTAPAARPETQPAARRTTKPATWPAKPPPAEPAARPAKPAAKPAGRPRQFRAMRLMVLAMTIPILFGLMAATGELALHGYGFFVFRSAGTGATQQGPSGPGPSQPPAAHHPHRPGPGQAGPREARHQHDRDGHQP
jgi:hypothetical protein